MSEHIKTGMKIVAMTVVILAVIGSAITWGIPAITRLATVEATADDPLEAMIMYDEHGIFHLPISSYTRISSGWIRLIGLDGKIYETNEKNVVITRGD